MEIVIAVIGSGALSAVISGIFTLINSRKKKNTGVTAGTRVLLYDRIKCLGRRYIAANCVESEDLEDLIEMHNVYHNDLGGNGYLDAIMDSVKKLPIK